MRKLLTTALSCALLSAALPAMAQDTFAIINAKVVTNDGSALENATILVEDGKVKAIGATDTSANAPQPNGTTIIDGSDKWVTPGIFAPYGQIGLVEVSLEASTRDTQSGDSVSQASLKAADGFNPKSSAVSATMGEGVTHVAIGLSPRANVFGGIGAIANMSGDFDSVETPESFAFVQLPASTALGFFGAESTGDFFGDACRVDPAVVAADPLLTGLVVYSKRAKGVAAWMSGAEVVAVKADVATKEVVLSCGLADAFLFARLVGRLREEGKAFERAKEAAGGLHFLAVMVEEGSDEVEGFWLLREPQGLGAL